MANKIRIASELITAAEQILAAEYVWDPRHKNKPRGGNWHRTPHGWSNIPKVKMAPISFDDDDDEDEKPVETPSRKTVIPKTKLAPISFDDDEDEEPAVVETTPPEELDVVEEPVPGEELVEDVEEAPLLIEENEDKLTPPEKGMPHDEFISKMDGYLRGNFQNVRRGWQDSFFFDYKNAEYCSAEYTSYNGKFSFSAHGMPDGQSIDIDSRDFASGVAELKRAVDTYEPDQEMVKVKGRAEELLSGWDIEDMYRQDDTIVIHVLGKARGDSYNVYCEMQDGEIVGQDESERISDRVKRLSRDTGVKNLMVSGYAE